MHARQSSSTQQHGVLWWLMRGTWGFLAAIHLWPFAALATRLCTDPSAADAFWLLSLVGVIALFGLKAVDSRRLRFQRPGLEFTAFILAAALIHGDVVSRQELPALTVETTTAVVTAAATGVAASRRVRRRVAHWLRGLAGRTTIFGHARRPIEVLALIAWHRPARMTLCYAPARAPPSPIL